MGKLADLVSFVIKSLLDRRMRKVSNTSKGNFPGFVGWNLKLLKKRNKAPHKISFQISLDRGSVQN
jgi:hypothetical protein